MCPQSHSVLRGERGLDRRTKHEAEEAERGGKMKGGWKRAFDALEVAGRIAAEFIGARRSRKIAQVFLSARAMDFPSASLSRYRDYATSGGTFVLARRKHLPRETRETPPASYPAGFAWDRDEALRPGCVRVRVFTVLNIAA